MTDSRFPTIPDDQMRRRLTPPGERVRLVIDTDAANEIDDQFALAWALLSQDRLHIEAIYAAPYSVQYRLDELIRISEMQSAGQQPTEEERKRNAHYSGHIGALLQSGVPPHQIKVDGPDVGMEKSYQEILRILDKVGIQPQFPVLRGSTRYLRSYDDPVRSDAADHLIALARTASPDDPLYIAAIGCPTTIASALLLAPDILPNIVITWTAAFPTTMNRPNYSFNLEQDMLASQLLFDCGAPFIYLPGYHIGAQLRISEPDMALWVRDKGAIGDYLYHIYTHNPLFERQGIAGFFGRTWIIWDLINIAWLLDGDWVPTALTRAPRLTDDKYWQRDLPQRHLIAEAYDIDRDAIFRDFLRKLDTADR